MRGRKKSALTPARRMRAALEMARSAVARHEAKLADETLVGHLRILRREYLTNAKRRVRKLEAALANGVHYEEKQQMRPIADETPFPVTPPSPGWRLTAWGQRRIAGHVVHHGHEIPNELIAQCAHLIRSGYVRWTPPSVPKPPPSPPPISRSEPPLVDPIAACRSEIRRIMKDRGVDFATAIDLIDTRVYLKAQKHFADTPRTAVDGGFGSGGRARIQSGVGTSRRSTAGFTEHLREGL